MSRIAIFEGTDADTALVAPAAPKQRRRGYKRGKTSPKQEARQGKFKTCVRECKGKGQYRVCMSSCLKSTSAMNGAKRKK